MLQQKEQLFSVYIAKMYKKKKKKTSTTDFAGLEKSPGGIFQDKNSTGKNYFKN